MDVDFTPEQEQFVQLAIQSGRLQSAEEAAREAFGLWAERERRRSAIFAAIDEAEASLAQGKGRTITSNEESRGLAEDIKQRGIARLNSEQTTVG